MNRLVIALATLIALLSAMLLGLAFYFSSRARCLQDYDSIKSLLVGGVSGIDLYLQDTDANPVSVNGDNVTEYLGANGYLSVSIMSDCGFVVFDVEAIAAGEDGEVAAAYFTTSGVYTATFDADVKQYPPNDVSVRDWIQSLPKNDILTFGLSDHRPQYLLGLD